MGEAMQAGLGGRIGDRAGLPIRPIAPAIDDTMMIDPPPPAFIFGMQYLVQSIVLVRLASSTLCQSSSVTVSGVPGAPMPTLLCRMSSRP